MEGNFDAINVWGLKAYIIRPQTANTVHILVHKKCTNIIIGVLVKDNLTVIAVVILPNGLPLVSLT